MLTHETGATSSTSWGDGLPLAAVTDELRGEMVRGSMLPGDAQFGPIPPMFRTIGVEELADMAVASGCPPAAFGVLEAGLQACLESQFNLLGIQTTTEPATPLLVVNGPARQRAGINCGSGVLGPTTGANGAVGRALRLTLTRYGGAIPGETDMATFGCPGKYAYCIAENEEANPWPPFHAARGFAPLDSVVTAIGVDSPINVSYADDRAEDLLVLIARTMAQPGTNNAFWGGEIVVLISPQHADLLHRAGLAREDVQERLFDAAYLDLSRLPPTVVETIMRCRASLGQTYDGQSLVPVTDNPESVIVIVAGGIGGHSTVIPSFGETRAVSVAFPATRPDVSGAGPER